MNLLSNWLPDCRLLERHLIPLGQTLQGLIERWRDGVAQAIGASVANVVRDIVRVLFADPQTVVPRRPKPDDFWDHDEEKPWLRTSLLRWDEGEDQPFQDNDEDVEMVERPCDDESAPARWSRAVAVGCATVAWWLRRRCESFSLLETLGLGSAAALVVYVAGPIAAALGSGSPAAWSASWPRRAEQ